MTDGIDGSIGWLVPPGHDARFPNVRASSYDFIPVYVRPDGSLSIRAHHESGDPS